MINNTEDRNVGRNDFTDSVKLYYQELKKFSPMSKEEERALMIKAKDGDIESRNKIITANLRFVFDTAKKYRGNNVDMADLISEGNKGIIKAIEKFDINNDVKFFTYAVWWIRQHMIKAIENKANEAKCETSFDDEFPNETRNIENVAYSGDDDGYYNGNDLEGDNGESIYESNEESNQKTFVVKKLLSSLDGREKTIIMKYFGIGDDEKGHSLEEISSEMGLSTERVRQLKVKAINSMRSEVFSIEEAKILFK